MVITVKFKKTHVDAKLPERNHGNIRNDRMSGLLRAEIDVSGTHDTGYDIFAVESVTIPAKKSKVVPVGLQLAFITPGYWIKIESKSGLGFKHGLMCHPGIIDNQFTGDMGVKVYNFSDKEYTFNKGDKVAQLVAYPLIDMKIEETDTINKTSRGEKGFGSSGK